MKAENCAKWHPEAKRLRALIPFWPFTGTYCTGCKELTSDDWGHIKMFFWDILVGWWWNGMALIEDFDES